MVCVCDKHTDGERSRSVGLCNSMMFVFLKWDTIKSYLQYEHCNWLNVFLTHVWSSLDHSTTLVLLIQPVCTSLLFTLLFIKSPYTGFLFFLHILLFCTFFISLHILLLFHHIYALVLYFISFLFLLFCTVHWADLIRLHFTSNYTRCNLLCDK